MPAAFRSLLRFKKDSTLVTQVNQSSPACEVSGRMFANLSDHHFKPFLTLHLVMMISGKRFKLS